MARSSIALALTVVLLAFGPPAQATAGEWKPPVDVTIVRHYEPPPRPFGPQHLGLDFAAAPGTPVRAANDGVVAFAGLVGGSRSVALEHRGARRSTYAYLRRVVVRPGTPVRRGDVLGFSGGEGPRHHADVVHFGYRVKGRAQDPAPLFERPKPRISLAPLDAPACRYTGPQPDPSRSEIHMPAGSIGVRP